MNLSRYKARLKKKLSAERYSHSLRVAEWAKEIALLCGADPDNAYLAGLLHDCARENTPAKFLAKAKKNGIRLTAKYRRAPVLLHGELGACAASQKFGVRQPDILNAIKNHTLGRARMSCLEKIIFVADYTEPARKFPEARKIRRRLLTDKDLARAVSSKVRYMLEYRQTLKKAENCSPAHKRKS